MKELSLREALAHEGPVYTISEARTIHAHPATDGHIPLNSTFVQALWDEIDHAGIRECRRCFGADDSPDRHA